MTTVPDNGSEEREPNNTPDRARTSRSGKAVRGTVYPAKDVDYYRLDLSDRPVRTPITATLLGILKVDVGLYLHRLRPDGKLTLVQTSDRAKGDQPETIRYSAEPGVYVLRGARREEPRGQLPGPVPAHRRGGRVARSPGDSTRGRSNDHGLRLHHPGSGGGGPVLRAPTARPAAPG